MPLPSGWNQVTGELRYAWLRAAGWPGERSLSSVEHQTVMKFHSTLAEFGTLDAVTAPLSASSALSRLQELLRDTPFEAETQATSITVIDPATVAGPRGTSDEGGHPDPR